ncbi:ABC-F family ATP-binding cassette domain-containing protein [Microvirga flavescens]|uniref:ABC-F family ATP-binding cassette domain-containing protein n=1 Tax=Microvirga flavescens TaxID=2249811 RepID=UPI000DD6003D|nr:ABC-F family ATP-binding cassette domain-containing protein [Microvirga flavescens]
MGSIGLRNATVLAQNPLFKNLTLTISERDRLGLVAGNGAGKSTLLKCLAGLAEPTHGEVVRSRGLKIAFVEQDVPERLLDLSLHQAILDALPPVEQDSQGWRVDVILADFEAPFELRERALRHLSGGWQRLALIARAWVTEPDALLLDEPTNHLDLEKIMLLERWLSDAAGQMPMVIASHDRDFLDACTNRTLFLRPEESVSFNHPYRRARALLEDHDAAAAALRDKALREVRRLRENASELRNIAVNSGSDLAHKKSAQLKNRAEKLEQTVRDVHRERPGEIKLGARGTHAKVLVTVENVAVAKPDGVKLFDIKKLEIAQGDRIVLLGRNGVGKSQLVRLLHRALGGNDVPGIRISPSVVSAYADQDMAQLPQKETAHGFILSAFRHGDQRSRALLAEAGFPIERQNLPIAKLSSGQKARLGLLALHLTEPNFYLMDEPTNHVDIPGREMLEAELLANGATALLVSHDRSFVKAVGTRFLLIEGRRIAEIDGPEVFYETLAQG